MRKSQAVALPYAALRLGKRPARSLGCFDRASANSVFTYDQDPPNSAAAEARKELDKFKAEAKKLAKANAAAAAKPAEHQSLLALQDKGAGKGKTICFHFRDHGGCPPK